jgi:cytochrome c
VRPRTLPSLLAASAAFCVLAVVAAAPAVATPDRQSDCTSCHGGGLYRGVTTAAPSTPYPAAGATYSVAIGTPLCPSGTYNTGYWIANSTAAGATGTTTGVYGGNVSATHSYSASIKAPAAEGVFYYKVFAVDGPKSSVAYVNFVGYSITVDKTAPVTQDNADALPHSTFTLVLTPTDAVSGVALTEYKVDGGAWTPGIQVRLVRRTRHRRGISTGTHTVAYRSTDAAGNVESAKSCQVILGS